MSNVRRQMKISCSCGEVIRDQTDYLSSKAHLIADQDWEDFAESSEKQKRLDRSYVRLCYQCSACGRLYIEDPSRALQCFVPEGVLTGVLASSRGPDWPAPLIGSWADQPFGGGPKGRLWCEAEQGIADGFSEWAELERAYYELFGRLRSVGRLRSAYLSRNGKAVHSWARDA